MGLPAGLSAFALALALVGCAGGGDPAGDGAACYPELARRWIGSTGEGAGGPARDPGGPYSVYVDGSASMVGFLRGATAGERPLADLISMLPRMETVDRDRTELVRFDRDVTPVSAADLSRLQTEAGYACGRAGSCASQESHLDQALTRIASGGKDRLSVLVSDLWLTNSEVRTTGGVALAGPLADIMADGRSVAVYGFESPYSGRVFDLPSGSRTVTAAKRFLFVLAIGPVDRLEAFHSGMTRASSASIQRDLASGRARYSLFTTQPLRSVPAGTQDFEQKGGGALTRRPFLPARTGVRVPQFSLDRSAALRSSAASSGSVRWAGVGPDAVRTGAVWTGESRGSTRLFRMASDDCLPKGGDWREAGAFAGGGSGRDFALRPSDLVELPRGSYLLVGGLERTSLEAPNPAARWLREWSFEASGEAAATARPVMPTLNLDEVARLLENALAQAAERRPVNLGGFAVAVKID